MEQGGWAIGWKRGGVRLCNGGGREELSKEREGEARGERRGRHGHGWWRGRR